MRFRSFPSSCLARIIGMSAPGAVAFTRGSHLLTWANRLIWNGCWGLTTISTANIARFPPLSPFTHIPYTPCLLSFSFSGIYNIRGEISLQKSRPKLWSFKCLDFQGSKNSSLETFTSVCGLGSYWIEGRVCTEKGLSGVACERTMNRSRTVYWDFLGGAVVKNPPACAGDLGSIPGPGKSHVLWGNMP